MNKWIQGLYVNCEGELCCATKYHPTASSYVAVSALTETNLTGYIKKRKKKL